MTSRIGVIGAGGMGREHITNLHQLEGADVVVVADISSESAAAGAHLAGAEASTNPMAVATMTDLDGVVIASPDDTHAELAIAALHAGLPVLCEKPLALTVEDARRVAGAEAAAGDAHVQLGFMRVYDPAHQQVAVAMADLGALHHLRLVHRNTNADWQRSLDTVVSQSIVHDIHSARWFSHSEFRSVVTQVVRSNARIEYVTVLAEMTNDASVVIEFAEATYGYDIEVVATCAHGTALAPQPSQPDVRLSGESHQHIGNDWFCRFSDAYRLQVVDWVAGLRTGQVTGPTTADGLAAQVVAAAVLESAATGQRVLLG